MITDEGVAMLSSLTSLESLDLTDCSVSDDALNELNSKVKITC